MLQAHGTVHTRNPASGMKRICGELYTATSPIATSLVMARRSMPELCERLEQKAATLEAELRDAATFDFHWADGTLTVENPRPLQREVAASVKIAANLVTEGLNTPAEALLKVNPADLSRLLAPVFSTSETGRAARAGRMLLQGRGAGFGVATGRVAHDSARAHQLHRQGHPVILVCRRLTYEVRDALPFIAGFVVGEGPTAAALLFEKPGVVAEIGSLLTEQQLSLDGESGKIFQGRLGVLPGAVSHDLNLLLGFADQLRGIPLRANVSGPAEVELAAAFGAEGIGLCRIESLFQKPHRLPLFAKVLDEVCVQGLSDSESLSQLELEIKQDVAELFAAGGEDGSPFILRLLDVPVAQMLRFWKEAGFLEPDYFREELAEWLLELNPLGGLRFGRLSLVYPPLLNLQIRAVLAAWGGRGVRLQLMMPGVSEAGELELFAGEVKRVCKKLEIEPPMIGSMLETPRACLTVEQMLETADFFSFGTGDLTESVWGLSRYDAPVSLLPHLINRGVFAQDPFQVLDRSGVGSLIRQAFQAAKLKNPTVELGTCGAQAVEESSLWFCCEVGLDYVSVPVHHLPAARLAAARWAIRNSSCDHHRGS